MNNENDVRDIHRTNHPEGTILITVKDTGVQDEFLYFVAKEDFLTKCPHPNKSNTHELMEKYSLAQHLHNPNGPAVVLAFLDDDDDRMYQYFLDGVQLSKEEGERIAHKNDYLNRLDDELNKLDVLDKVE